MATITISRQFGAGGRTLGRQLAKKLGYYYADDVMVREVAQRMNVSHKQVRGFEKEGASNLMKILDKFLSADYISRLISDKYGFVCEEKYVNSIQSIIKGLHEEGNAIIIGRGGQYILKGQKNTFHILLVREMSERVAFLEKKYKMGRTKARKTVNRIDKNRKGFLNFFSGQDNTYDEPLMYDLVINMGRVSMDKAEKLVVNLISK